ncbi:MAG: oligosaccharide flippase family protein [Planctomycetota bacterium]|jgi:O-antigen/teichoic acid export membrane protein
MASSMPIVASGEPAPTEPAPRSTSARSLRSLAIRGSAWTVIGYGGTQVIRLVSNLITTRLLLPEHFGLMSLVMVWTQALEMFSDLGINTNIIQSKHGDDPSFLDTAFTIQSIRGVVLWLGVCALAWPTSLFYGEPMLLQLLPVAGFSAVLAGLTSVSLATHSRHLELGRLTVLELVSALVAVVTMITLAVSWKSVWPLVIGGLAGATVKLVASHTLLRTRASRFRWDADAARALVRFGRWILVSSILGFFVNRGDIAVIGKLVPMSLLGVFHIGSQFAVVVRQLYFRLAETVLYPLLVKLGDRSDDELRRKVRLMRLGVMALMLPPLWLFAVAGPQFIDLLYDDRYLEAGDMLQILAIGVIFVIVPDVGPVYLARGNSFLFMVSLIVRSGLLFGCMVLGAALAGMWGLIAGVAASAALFYPYQVWICRKYRIWLPMLDLVGFGVSAAVIWAGLWLVGSI